MPMQPRPMADTSRSLCPSLRFCILCPVTSEASFEGGLPRLGADHRVHMRRAVASVFGAVLGIGGVGDRRFRIEQLDILPNAASLDVTLVAHLRATEPR